MAHIDTYNYLNGELRLSIHGARRGGNVLMHTPTGRQTKVYDTAVPHLSSLARNIDDSEAVFDIYEHAAQLRARRAED